MTVILGLLQIANILFEEGEVQRFSSCRFLIGGEIIVSGSCEVSRLGDDSYYVNFDTKDVFVYLLKDDADSFRGYWNEYESHAHTPIGTLSVDGDCWSGEIARLCLK